MLSFVHEVPKKEKCVKLFGQLKKVSFRKKFPLFFKDYFRKMNVKNFHELFKNVFFIIFFKIDFEKDEKIWKSVFFLVTARQEVLRSK